MNNNIKNDNANYDISRTIVWGLIFVMMAFLLFMLCGTAILGVTSFIGEVFSP